MKTLIREWRQYLNLNQPQNIQEDKTDPLYSQDTFNMFLLLRIDADKGGNRDQIKNDLRAIEEILTARTIEPHEGGIQKAFPSHALSSMKLRVRLPPGRDRKTIARNIVANINSDPINASTRWRRGLWVKDWRVEESEELREEEAIQKAYKRGHSRKKNRLIGKGGNRHTGGGKGHTRPSMKRAKSSPAGFGGAAEE